MQNTNTAEKKHLKKIIGFHKTHAEESVTLIFVVLKLSRFIPFQIFQSTFLRMEFFFFSVQCKYYIVSCGNSPTKAVIFSKGLNLLQMQIHHILKLKPDSIAGSFTESFTPSRLN